MPQMPLLRSLGLVALAYYKHSAPNGAEFSNNYSTLIFQKNFMLRPKRRSGLAHTRLRFAHRPRSVISGSRRGTHQHETKTVIVVAERGYEVVTVDGARVHNIVEPRAAPQDTIIVGG